MKVLNNIKGFLFWWFFFFCSFLFVFNIPIDSFFEISQSELLCSKITGIFFLISGPLYFVSLMIILLIYRKEMSFSDSFSIAIGCGALGYPYRGIGSIFRLLGKERIDKHDYGVYINRLLQFIVWWGIVLYETFWGIPSFEAFSKILLNLSTEELIKKLLIIFVGYIVLCVFVFLFNRIKGIEWREKKH